MHMSECETIEALGVDERGGALLVQTFVYDPGGHKELVIDIAGDESAGGDAWRRTIYASDTARVLGFGLLPALAEGDLVVEGPQLEVLEREAMIVEEWAALFAARAGLAEADVASRANNIARAARRAADLGGGVLIW
jgi:hypothetical protein